jgi:ATP-dependent DNA helicase RecQ
LKESKLVDILTKIPGSSIVYVRSRKATRGIAQFLQQHQLSSTYYHAGLSHADRADRQQQWVDDKVRVMVATNAFGMGINKANVRTVIHLDLPENLESYYQEAGRAGRDGKRSYATVLYHPTDIDSLRTKAEQAYPTFEYLKKIYQALANHFQVAVHAGQGESYDFILDDFAKKFAFKNSSVYPALKRLEEVGLVQFNESFYHPSRLHFSADKKRIYEFQVAHVRYDAIIKMILRLYGGEIYSDFVTISETQLAVALKQSTPDVIAQLGQLHQLQLIHYSPVRDSPQITYTIPRQDPSLLVVDRMKMETRRKLYFEKTEAMIAYVQQNHQCRMQVIQQYFDEATDETCGFCDVCYAKKKEINRNIVRDLEAQIKFCLQDASLSPEELMKLVATPDEELFLDVVRELVDTNQLIYDSHWLLQLKK